MAHEREDDLDHVRDPTLVGGVLILRWRMPKKRETPAWLMPYSAIVFRNSSAVMAIVA
jgi:hypothetical protein